MLTLQIISKLWPHGDQHIPGLMAGIVASASEVLDRYGISKLANPRLVLAHMMGQFSEECGQGLEMIESLNYTAARLREVFPTHFTPSMAQRWAHNERMIGEIAYGGRMGNAPPPSTDGYDFRGAGLSQVTGRGIHPNGELEGCAALQKKLDEMHAGFNILENPALIISPEHTFECGVADYIVCGCLPHAEHDDTLGETRALNGGTNGLAERERQIALWKRELLSDSGPALIAGTDIKWVQEQLNRLGMSPPLDIDGHLGPQTETYVKAFQTAHHLSVDGIPGPETIATMKGLA
jgi:putative chitinase